MAEPRKVFRIEQTAPARLEEAVETVQAGLRHTEIMRELQALRSALAAAAPRWPRTTAMSASRPRSRLEHELNAVARGTEQATQKILAAAEAIDSAAATLAAELNGKTEQDLTQGIQELVIEIYEACNFQDLISQRVGKILAALKYAEDHIARGLDEMTSSSAAGRNADGHALHGPRLDGDPDHASQADIDAMFAKKQIANNE